MTVPRSVTLWVRRHRAVSVSVAVLLFAAISVADLISPSDEIIVLLAAPLAILALAFGFRMGLVGAVSVGAVSLALGPRAIPSDLSRTLILLLVGGPMGFCSDRMAEAQAALVRRTEGEATLADLVPGQVWTARPDGHLDYANVLVSEYFGLSPASLASTSWQSLMHPDDVPSVAQMWRKAVMTGAPYEATFRLRRHDGEYRRHIGRAVPQRDADGVIVRWCGTNVDVSDEHARHEQLSAGRRALEESEQRYRLLFEHSPNPKWLFNTQTLGFTAVNAAALATYGYTEAEFLSLTICDIRPAEDVEEFLRWHRSLGARSRNESRHRTKSGAVMEVEVFGEDMPGTSPPQRLVIAHDITERKATERALRDSEERYRQIVETASEGIWQIDAEHRTTFVNPKMAEMLGHTAPEMLGHTMEEYTADRERPLSTRRVRQAFTHKDGSRVDTVLSRRLLGEPPGSSGVLAMVSDVTEQLKADEERGHLEAQLAQSQKMESVGQLAGGIAHDFNNLLAVILNYAEFAADPGSETVEDDLLQIRRAAERAAALTRKLLTFSRKAVTQPEVVEINELVEGAHQLLERTLGEHVELESRYGADVPRILADPVQVEQVLLNLAVNARDAMPAGGGLLLETSAHVVGPGERFGTGQPRPGNYACVRVSDTGCGMSAATATHAFEPFFTTKAKGEGTGLGLATMHGFIAQAGGYIDLRSDPGRGTTVAFILPATSEPVQPRSPEALEPENRPATILLAEDEEEVRNLAARILTNHGYNVLAALDPLDAVATCNGYPGEIDLLLTDVVMPKMPGPELAKRVTALRPDIHVLFMSGYPDREASSEALPSLISKPFDGQGLTRAVADALT